MIELKQAKANVNIQYPGFEGEAGGYYAPNVDEAGNLSWTPSKAEMPVVETVNISGPQGVPGKDGESGVYIGTNPPQSANVWINPEGEVEEDGLVTKEYVDSAIAEIELIPGPQGEQGPQGEAGKDGINGKDGEPGVNGQDGYTPVRGTDYWTEEDKTAIVNDVLNALPSAEEVEV